MEWVDGETLTKQVERAVHDGDTQRLSYLCDRFDALSTWLLEQTFAHNDLKPDNIMVRTVDSELVLIDYDGMFVESMSGEQAREFGTEPFQSSHRSTAHFDRNVDNYSIAYIRRALRILAREPKRYTPHSLVDFTPEEIAEIETNQIVFGYVDLRGRWWQQPIYDFAQSFRDGKSAVELKSREFFITYKP